MSKRNILIAGFFLMAFAVAMGAFGAHAWKEKLTIAGREDTYELGIRYLMIHALALLLMGILVDQHPRLRTSVILTLVGIFFFSGSLLTLALTNNSMWGAVAPIGGTALILGWLSAAWFTWRA